MKPYNFILILILGSVLIYITQRIFIHYKKFDSINHRSSHNTLATRTWSIGGFLSLFIVSLFYYFKSNEIYDFSLLIPLGIMFVVGVYDDFYDADFKLKFFFQIIVSKILIDQGFVISNFQGLFGIYELPWLLAQIITVLAFLTLVNAINLIDGIDGLATTEVIKIILLFEFLGDQFTPFSSLGFIVVISLLPQYYFNFKKENKVFLGDGGTLLLGTLVSIYLFYAMSSEYQIRGEFSINKIVFCFLVLLYPLTDLFRVFFVRIKNGKSPFHPDKNHIHHLFMPNSSQLKRLIGIQGIYFLCFILVFGIAKII
jgi:UDP-N-acetylmuramyl pentapeptide phosphotransferase/UDP-N-acetylglucosamine-1-phosphate transferase